MVSGMFREAPGPDASSTLLIIFDAGPKTIFTKKIVLRINL